MKKKYSVNVYIQYDDTVEVEAESREEAAKLGEEEALKEVNYVGTICSSVNSVEEES